MKIVITGALGHIGSALVRFLPTAFPGATITMIDSIVTQRYASLFNLPPNVSYRFVEADVTTANLEPEIEGADVVIHVAAIVDAANSFDRRDEVMRVNFLATKRVAEACANTGAAMIFPSSTSVYGTQKNVVDEDCSEEDLKPQSPYAECKLREEAELFEMASRNRFRVAVCRFGTIFGTSPGMRFHTAINKFCWQAITGQPLTVWRTAYHQKRPYLDLGDCCRAVAFIIAEQRFEGGLYNVLTLNATVAEVVEAIRRRQPSLKMNFVDSPIMNQLSYEVLCDRFKGLGFAFRGNLQDGIDDTFRYLGGLAPEAAKTGVSAPAE